MSEPPTPGALQPTQDRLLQLIDSIEIDGIYMLDQSGHVLTWNRGAELNKGYTRQEILGQHYSLFFTPEDAAAGLPQSILDEAAGTGRKTGEAWRLRKDGQRFWASFVLTAMRDTDGALIGYSKVIRDLTGHKLHEEALLRLQAQLQEERDRLQAAAESSLDALFLLEAVRAPEGHIEDFTFTFLNSNVQPYLPAPRAQLLGQRLLPILPSSPALAFFDHYRAIVETGQPLIHEYSPEDHPTLPLQTASTTYGAWLRMQAVKLHDGLAITIANITERKHYQLQFEYLAQHDQLTGLLNRNLLDHRIQMAIARASHSQRMVAFLILDLDLFKEINDTWGHAAGDHVLRTVAQRLNALIRSTDTLIRIGGDEFVLILPDIAQLRDLIPIVSKLADSLKPPISLNDQAIPTGNAETRAQTISQAAIPSQAEIPSQSIHLSCSIGIAVYPNSAREPSELLRRADTAMYTAKEAGQNLTCVFLPHPNNPNEGVFFSLDKLPVGEQPSPL